MINKVLPAVLSPFGPCRPEFQHYTLENGLQVVLCRDVFKPKVSVSVTYHVGAGMEEPGKTGITHLIEHLMFNKSEHFPFPEMDMYLQEIGDVPRGYTNLDLMFTSCTAPRDTLEKILRLDSDRMGFLLHTITQQDIENEKKVIIQELLNNETTYHENPWFIVFKLLFEPTHPYNAGAFGNYEDIINWHLEDVREHFQKYVRPNNAVLTITGDFDYELAKQLVQKYFGEIPRGEALPKPEQKALLLSESKSFTWLNESCKNPLLGIYLPLPQVAYEKQILVEIALWYFLNHRKKTFAGILQDEELAAWFRLRIENFERCSYATQLIDVAQSADINRIITLWDEYLQSFEGEEIDISTMADAINKYLNFHQQQYQDITKLGLRMGQDTILRGKPDAVFDDFETLDTLERDDIREMILQIINCGKYHIFSVLHPDKSHLAAENSQLVTPVFFKDIAQPEPSVQKPEPAALPRPESLLDRSIDPPYLVNTPAMEYPEIWSIKLDNGMKLLGIQSGYEHEIGIQLIFRGGALFNPPDKKGLSDMVVRLLRKSRSKESDSTFDQEFKNIDAELKIRSYNAYIQLEIQCSKKRLSEVMSVLESMLTAPGYDQKMYDEVKASILRLIEIDKTHQYVQLDMLAHKLLCGFSSPHAIPSFMTNAESIEILESFSSDDISQYFKQCFNPHLAHCLVYGNINPDNCQAHFKSLETNWTGTPQLIPEPVIEPEKPGTYETTISGTTQTYVKLVMPILQSDRPDIHNTIAFYPLGSKQYLDILNTEIRDKYHFAYHCYSGIESLYHTRYFYFSADVDPGNVQQVMSLVENILTTYPETYSKEHFEKSKQSLLRKRLVHFDKPDAYMKLLSNIALHDLPIDYFEQQEAEIRAMTYEQAVEIIRENLGERRYNWVVV